MEWTKNSLYRNKILRRYEPVQPLFFKYFCTLMEIDAFYDVGANIGYYSILLSSHIQGLRTYSFEPSPWAFGELEENIRLNGLNHQVLPYPVALSSDAKKKDLFIISPLSGANTFYRMNASRNVSRKITIDCKPLDDFRQSSYENIGVKIDVEGHELEVLKGGKNLLTENTVLLQIEILESEAVLEVSSYLKDLGYEKFFRIGPDYYFTNDSLLYRSNILLIEKFFDFVVERSKS